MQKDQHIIIIGAGAAGLMAARELSPHYQVTVLEAQSMPGGRIRTVHGGESQSPIEAGAEFVHGELPVTLSLLKEAGLSYTEIEGDMYKVNDGNWKKQEEMIEGWDEILKRMGEVKSDMTLDDFLSRYYNGEKHESLRRYVKRYAQGFDLADVRKVSVMSLYNEWHNEQDKNFRIDKGYDALINFLASDCAIHTNTVVRHIKWERNNVTILTEEGQTYNAHKVILTVPISVLQNDLIVFDPAITDYTAAARNIGFGNVIKLSLLFKNAFWESRQKEIGFILSEEKIPTWWTQLPSGQPLLTGWLGGPPSDDLADKTEPQILELALSSLSRIFQMDVSSLLVSSHITDWSKQPYALGAYSYSTPASSSARQKLNTPLQGTIYFAGEALYEGTRPGTVEAALVSGKNIAHLIMQPG